MKNALIGLALVISSAAAAGCAVDLHKREGTTVFNDLSFQCTRQIRNAKIKLNDGAAHVLFCVKSDPASKTGTIFNIPLIDARCKIEDEKTLLASLPDGKMLSLKKINKDTYQDTNWFGSTQGNTTTLKSQCGWSIIYTKGVITEANSPRGDKIIIKRGENIATIFANSQKPITISRKSTVERPDVNIIISSTPTSEKITISTNEKTTSIVLDENQCTIDDEAIMHTKTGKAVSDKKFNYKIIEVFGVKCIKREQADGKSAISGRNDSAIVNKSLGSDVITLERHLPRRPGLTSEMSSYNASDLSLIATYRYYYDEELKLVSAAKETTKEHLGIDLAKAGINK